MYCVTLKGWEIQKFKKVVGKIEKAQSINVGYPRNEESKSWR